MTLTTRQTTATCDCQAGHVLPANTDAGECLDCTDALAIGDRVESGTGNDHDTGRIVAIDGDRAEVAWQTGVRTWQPLAMLSRLA